MLLMPCSVSSIALLGWTINFARARQSIAVQTLSKHVTKLRSVLDAVHLQFYSVLTPDSQEQI